MLDLDHYLLFQLCGLKFFSEVDLKNHQEHSHSVDSGFNVFVTQCENVKSTSPCNTEKVLQCCFYCKQTFKSRMEMSKHMRIHHITPSTQKCNICDEIFSSSLILAEHKLNHCKVILQIHFISLCKRNINLIIWHCTGNSKQLLYSLQNNVGGRGGILFSLQQSLFSGIKHAMHYLSTDSLFWLRNGTSRKTSLSENCCSPWCY